MSFSSSGGLIISKTMKQVFFFFFDLWRNEPDSDNKDLKWNKNRHLHCSDNRNVICWIRKRGNLSISGNQHNYFLFSITFELMRNAYHQASDWQSCTNCSWLLSRAKWWNFTMQNGKISIRTQTKVAGATLSYWFHF